jgi:predicted acetyltransferase
MSDKRRSSTCLKFSGFQRYTDLSVVFKDTQTYQWFSKIHRPISGFQRYTDLTVVFKDTQTYQWFSKIHRPISGFQRYTDLSHVITTLLINVDNFYMLLAGHKCDSR